MPAVRVKQSGEHLQIENDLIGISLYLRPDEVTGLQWVVSPFGDDCLQFLLDDGRFLIVSPDDFVFDVQQEGFIRVENLPPIVSFRELMFGFEEYQKNPLPSDNYDENLGLFYLHLAIFRSAENHGMKVPMMPLLLETGRKNGIWMDSQG